MRSFGEARHSSIENSEVVGIHSLEVASISSPAESSSSIASGRRHSAFAAAHPAITPYTSIGLRSTKSNFSSRGSGTGTYFPWKAGEDSLKSSTATYTPPSYQIRYRQPPTPFNCLPVPSAVLAGMHDPSSTGTAGMDEHVMKQSTRLVEFSHAQLYSPPGVYVIPSTENPATEWDGVVFVREGWYQGGIYRFVLSFPSDYPSVPPVLRFVSDVYHPLVDADSGVVDMTWWFPDWDREDCNAVALLGLVRLMFYRKEYFMPRSGGQATVEDEAAKMPNAEAFLNFKRNPKKFLELVIQGVEDSQMAIRHANEMCDNGGAVAGESVTDSSHTFQFNADSTRSASFHKKREVAFSTALTEFVSRGAGSEDRYGAERPETLFREWFDQVYLPTFICPDGEPGDNCLMFDDAEGGESQSDSEGVDGFLLGERQSGTSVNSSLEGPTRW